MEDKITELKNVLEQTLTLLELTGKVEGKIEEETILLSISTETPALLIGYHGKTIAALQTILGVIAYKKFGESMPIVVDVDGWRERRKEVLTKLALSAAQKAKETNTPQPIYRLTPFERRIVHLILSDDKEVTTESEGEGRERYIVVKLRSE